MANSLPGVYVNIQENSLQLITGAPEGVVLNMGVSASGSLNVPVAFGSPSQAQSQLLGGSGLSYCSAQFAASGGPVLFMPVSPNVNGGVGDGVYSGTQQGTIGVSFGPITPFAVKIVTGGALGTFAVSLNGGAYGTTTSLPQSADGYAKIVPGLNYTKLTFSSGGSTFVSGDVYSFAVNGTQVHTGSGSGTITQTSQVVDNYTPDITIDAYGTSTTSPRPQITYSLDGTSGSNISGVNVPSSNVLGIAGSGLVLTFSGIFNVGDGYSFQCCGPDYDQTSETAGWNAIPNQLQFSMVHICRGSSQSSAANALTDCTLVGTELLTDFNSIGRGARGIVPIPTLGSVSASAGGVVIDNADTDAVLISTFANFVSDYVDKVAGDDLMIDSLTGLSLRRPLAWSEAAICSAVSASTMSSATSGIPTLSDIGVISLFRDENNTPALDAAGFTTGRTFFSEPGLYITNSYLSGGPGSNFTYMVYGRVADLMAYYGRQFAFPFINSKIPTNPVQSAVRGSILPSFADVLDTSGTTFMENAMVPGDLVAVKLQVDRNHSLVDKTLPININGQVYLYSQIININVALVLQVG